MFVIIIDGLNSFYCRKSRANNKSRAPRVKKALRFPLRFTVAKSRRHSKFEQNFMLAYLWVAIGGALGSVGRFWLNNLVVARAGDSFPWGVLIINALGSFAIGIFAAIPATHDSARKFLMVGICGGFTTFSAFSLQTLELAQRGEWLRAGANILGSVALCLAAVWLGHLLGASFNSMKGN
jgi:fluoride exporter